MKNDRYSELDFIIYGQHGWADNNKGMAKLLKTLAIPKSQKIAPDLGFFRTWLRIEPLIERVELNLSQTIKNHPHTPIKIIGHSMGGLIWLEILDRQPQLRSKIHSLVLLGSPIGGADLARMVDPFGIGIGIARDLGVDRRAIATKIAAEIPTLVIAGDLDNGSDGVVTVESTKFSGAKFISLTGVFHPDLRNHPETIANIRNFWVKPEKIAATAPNFSNCLIAKLRSIPGMTDAHRRGYNRSQPYITFNNGIILRSWQNPLGIKHVFIEDPIEGYLWGGFVGWWHQTDLDRTLAAIKQEYQDLTIAN